MIVENNETFSYDGEDIFWLDLIGEKVAILDRSIIVAAGVLESIIRPIDYVNKFPNRVLVHLVGCQNAIKVEYENIEIQALVKKLHIPVVW